MADLDTLQTRLAEAEAAHHKLVTGAQVVSVGSGDDRVAYRNFAGDIDRLKLYIGELKVEISELTGEASTVVRRMQARI